MASNTSTVNKQNRLLLIALVVILAASAILVAVTGSANRKKENDPPLEKIGDQQIEEKGDEGKKEESKEGIKLTDSENKGEKEKVEGTVKPEEKKDEKKEEKTEKETEKTNAGEAQIVETVKIQEEEKLPELIAPVDSVVLKGASLTVPVFSYTMNDYRTHGGLDFACSPGTPVCAAAAGTITEVSDDPMMGVTVAVSHSGGAVTKYKGLAEETISMHEVGDEVLAGDVIGVSGDTALIESAEENHVHFELSVNGEVKDPAEYVSVVFLSDLTED